jgi:FHS family Na+ dependent glucose MFS transporter 1
MDTSLPASRPEPPLAAGRRQPTAAYFASFLAIGLLFASLGPALPYLAGRLGRPVESLAVLFTARSAGTLTGALLGGYLFSRQPGHRLAALMLLMLAGAFVLLPHAPLLAVLAAVLAVAGLAEGMLGVGLNTLISWEHPGRAAPYLNGLHFFFGVGAFFGPQLIALSLRLSGYVAWSYTALAVLVLPLVVWLFRLSSPAVQGRLTGQKRAAQNRGDALVLAALALFIALYAGAETGFGGWVYSYALERRIGDETGAALLTSAFWGAFTVGRLLSIPLATRWRPRYLIPAHLLLGLASLGLVLGVPYPAATWAGAVLYGLALAPIFPTTVALAGRPLQISSRVNAWLLVGGSLGGMTLPWLLGRVFGAWGPQALIAALFLILVLASLVLLPVLPRRRVDHSAQEPYHPRS